MGGGRRRGCPDEFHGIGFKRTYALVQTSLILDLRNILNQTQAPRLAYPTSASVGRLWSTQSEAAVENRNLAAD